MKRLILFGLLALGAIGASGQGTINFQNFGTTTGMDPMLFTAPVTNGLTGARAGSDVVAGLYYAPGTDLGGLDVEAMILLGAVAPLGTPQAGFFVGGTRTTPSSTPPGDNAIFQVRAWSAAFATERDAMTMGNPAQHVAGRSHAFVNDTGAPPLETARPLEGLGNMGFVANPVPEPSVIALGIAALGSLLLLRRRK